MEEVYDAAVSIVLLPRDEDGSFFYGFMGGRY